MPMNLRILDAHNALTSIQFNGGNKSKYETLKKEVKHLTEEDWETIKAELPDDYLMLRAWRKVIKSLNLNHKKSSEKRSKYIQMGLFEKELV